jgi:hypothetical protein
MLIPRDGMIGFLLQCEIPLAQSARYCSRTTGVQRLIEYFAAEITDPQNRARLLPAFKQLCTRLWKLGEDSSFAVLSDDAIETLLKALLTAQDWDFFEQAVVKLGKHVPLTTLLPWIVAEVEGGGLAVRDIEKGYAITAAAT